LTASFLRACVQSCSSRPLFLSPSISSPVFGCFWFSFPLSPPPPSSTLFPYTTLFRSSRWSGPEPDPPDPPDPPGPTAGSGARRRSEEHTSELQSRFDLVCRLLLEKKKLHPVVMNVFGLGEDADSIYVLTASFLYIGML